MQTRKRTRIFKGSTRCFKGVGRKFKNLNITFCRSEKDDIVYGFELGGMHSHMRQCFMGMMELESAIEKQELQKQSEAK